MCTGHKQIHRAVPHSGLCRASAVSWYHSCWCAQAEAGCPSQERGKEASCGTYLCEKCRQVSLISVAHMHVCVCVWSLCLNIFSVQAKTSSGPLFIKPNSVDGRAPIDSKLSIFGLFVGSLINTLHFLSHEYWFSISSFCNNGLNPILHTSGFCSTNNVRLVAPDLFLGGLFLVFYVYQILHTTIKPHLLGFTGFYFYKRGR